MAKKGSTRKAASKRGNEDSRTALAATLSPPFGRPSSLIDTRVIYCGDCLEQLRKPALSLPNGLPDKCIDLIYIDPAPVSKVEPPFNSNRNYEVFWGETKEKRGFEDRHAGGIVLGHG